jgi:hypothetical protein
MNTISAGPASGVSFQITRWFIGVYLVVVKNTTYVLKSLFPGGIIKKIERNVRCV